MSESRQHNSIQNLNATAVTFGTNSPISGLAAVSDAGHSLSRVLLVAAADIERDAIIDAARRTNGSSFRREYSSHHTIYSLGQISQTDVTLAHVAQGTVTPDAAGVAAPALIDAVRPDFIILVGICYGLRKEQQKPGDVLIANLLHLAAHRRISRIETVRGGSVHPSATLLDRFRTAGIDWDSGTSKVQIGQMVSESILVDSEQYIRRIKKIYPEAIGGEMEGAGVYAASVRSGIEWGLVKAICDWGFGKTDEHQRPAADNAASFVFHMISIGGLDPVKA